MVKLDPYLTSDLAIERLVREYNAHGKLIVAYDFDGTIYDFHGEGYKFDGVVELLKDIRPYAHLIVYTTSQEERYQFIREYLNKNGIPFDTINEIPNGLNVPRGGKMYYNILLDDRAGLGQAVETLESFLKCIKQMNKTRH